MEITWNTTHFQIPPEVRGKLQRVYPQFNSELPRMEMWVIANPQKKKKNWYRFMVNWLNKGVKQKVQERKIADDTGWRSKHKKMVEEAAPPSAEFKEFLRRSRERRDAS